MELQKKRYISKEKWREKSVGTKRVRSVHKLTPNKQEHITTFRCINTVDHYIPNFYIFKEKQMRENYI